MTNLLIAYPDIQLNALTTTLNQTSEANRNEYNLIAGARSQQFLLTANQASLVIKYDLGTAYTSVQNTVEYAIVARALIMQSQTSGFKIEYSDDDAAYTVWLNNAAFNSSTLYGPRSDDYIYYSTASAAHRYWRITYTASSNNKFNHSKLYLGKFWSAGKEIENYDLQLNHEATSFITSSGAKYSSRISEPYYTFKCRWKGLGDSVILDFQNKIARLSAKKSARFFLYTTAEHQVLNNHNLMHVQLVNYTTRRVDNILNRSDLEVEFVEDIG